MGVSFMTTFHFAVEFSTFARNRLTCAPPRKLRLRLLILSLQACETGSAGDGTTAENVLRVLCGAVGAKSGWPVSGLSQTWLADALPLRNERSSRKNTWRFFPQRTVR